MLSPYKKLDPESNTENSATTALGMMWIGQSLQPSEARWQTILASSARQLGRRLPCSTSVGGAREFSSVIRCMTRAVRCFAACGFASWFSPALPPTSSRRLL
jgi:hypothetical protein